MVVFIAEVDVAAAPRLQLPVTRRDKAPRMPGAFEIFGEQNIASTDDGHEIWTAPDDLHAVAEALEKSLGSAETVKLAWKPNLTVDMDEKNAGTLLKLIDALDDDDDVQTVWGNYDISDEVMEKLD